MTDVGLICDIGFVEVRMMRQMCMENEARCFRLAVLGPKIQAGALWCAIGFSALLSPDPWLVNYA